MRSLTTAYQLSRRSLVANLHIETIADIDELLHVALEPLTFLAHFSNHSLQLCALAFEIRRLQRGDGPDIPLTLTWDEERDEARLQEYPEELKKESGSGKTYDTVCQFILKEAWMVMRPIHAPHRSGLPDYGSG